MSAKSLALGTPARPRNGMATPGRSSQAGREDLNSIFTPTPQQRSSSGLFHSTISQPLPAINGQINVAAESDMGHQRLTPLVAKPSSEHYNGRASARRVPSTVSSSKSTSNESGVLVCPVTGQSAANDNISSCPQARIYEEDRQASSKEVVYTTSNGVPIPHPYMAQRAGTTGPLLLQDFHLIDLLSHFDREKIPERVVHAKGSGAHGIWECTQSLEDLCLASMFKKGAKCPLTVRFSTVGGESGSPDLARDPRGFAVKFRTEEGNWDFVGNNTPVFFLRDPAKFPHFIHTQKRDPATHLGGGDDSTMFWDYLSQNPEAIHQLMILMGDRGIPAGWRHMNGYYGHTLKIVNDNGDWVYAQFHLISDQGIRNFTVEQAADLSPDWGQKDLYQAIERGDYPSWTMKVQMMTEDQAQEAWEEKGINVLDLTHIWPHADYPLREIGRLTLNENAKNYFAEVEQAAFNPAHMIPGVEPSADPVLQSRLFSYPDAHRHRVGANYQQLPVNQTACPFKLGNFQRDGAMAFFNQGSRPAYLSSIEPIQLKERRVDLNKVHGNFTGNAVSYLSEIRPEDFNAPRALWEKVFNEESKERFIQTVSGHMSTCSRKEIIARQIAIFRAVSNDLASRLEKATGVKGYATIEGMTFNGSHSAMNGKRRAANGMKVGGEVVFNNGAPVRRR